MAQLHTLNVTPDFIKDALHEYSSHLELSHDGRKIRWKGGLDVTKDSSDSSSENYSGTSPYEQELDRSSPSKRLKTDHSGSTIEGQMDPDAHARKLARARREHEQRQFAYTPMFFRKEESEEDEDFYGYDAESSGNSLQRPQPTGTSSRIGGSAIQSSASNKRVKRDDGPMIFYTKAKFCTDLSGDRLGASILAPGSYRVITSHPVGASVQSSSTSHEAGSITETRGPLDATAMDVDSNSGSRTVSSDELLRFSPEALDLDTGDDSPAYLELEASGVGGVHPEDNFSIRVQRAHTQTALSGSVRGRRPSLYPERLREALSESGSPESSPASPASPQHIIKEEIISASRRSLPNSALPPASFLPFDSTSSGDVDSDLDSDMSTTEGSSESGEGPATALQLLNISPQPIRHLVDESDEFSEEASEYSDDSDDGSIDLLATARELDPNSVRNKEREYDAAVADRLAEEIVAGSSAATAGGGSGYNSPAAPGAPLTVSSVQQGHSNTSGSMSSRSKLKRERTSDSLPTKGAKAKNQKTTG